MGTQDLQNWIIDFYAGEPVIDGKPQKPVETVEIERVNAPTRWAREHTVGLRRKHQGAKITFSIERIG